MHYSKLNKDSKFIHVGKWDSKTNKLNYNDKDVAARASSVDAGSVVKVSEFSCSLSHIEYFVEFMENSVSVLIYSETNQIEKKKKYSKIYK